MKRVLLALTLLLTTVAFAQDDLNQWIQLLKQDLKVQRKDVITKGMQTFTHEEAKRFWPIDDAYNSELEKFVDARVALIKANAEELRLDARCRSQGSVEPQNQHLGATLSAR